MKVIDPTTGEVHQNLTLEQAMDLCYAIAKHMNKEREPTALRDDQGYATDEGYIIEPR